MALDHATTEFLAALTSEGFQPLHHLPPAHMRTLTAGLKDLYGPGPDIARTIEHLVPALDGTALAVRVLHPHGKTRALIVYYHGGGWMLGTIDEFDTLGRELAARTQCAVALVDYRLAPEHPHPVAVEDAWSALCWAGAQLTGPTGAKVPLIVAGDSAGANLATVAARRAVLAGAPAVSLQVLVYPVTDCDLNTPSYLDPDNQLLVTRDLMAVFWEQYIKDPGHRDNGDASPLRASDLRALPPAVVLTAEHDVLRDEGEAYVARMRAAGVDVAHRSFAGQMHGFFTMVNVLPGSAEGLDYIAAQIAEHLSEQQQNEPAGTE